MKEYYNTEYNQDEVMLQKNKKSIKKKYKYPIITITKKLSVNWHEYSNKQFNYQ
jgi:hypothetical protein